MDAHLSVTCAVLNPDAKARFTSLGGMPTCHAARCKTKLVVPFACAKCGESYCAPHRWETDHACTGAKASGSGGGRALGASGVGARASSGLAALRRAQASMLTATKTAASKANTPSGPSTAAGKRTAPSTAGSENATATTPPVGTKGNPLVIVDSDDDVQVVASKTSKTAAKAGGAKSLATATGGVLGTKTDKRAAAERASARKALEARAKKGSVTPSFHIHRCHSPKADTCPSLSLLTEKEKLTYATEVALEAERKNSKNGEGCLLS